MSIDFCRFLDFASRQVMKAWAAREHAGDIPFAPVRKPLSACTISLVSTAGIARLDDRPFDQEASGAIRGGAIPTTAWFRSARPSATSVSITCTSTHALDRPTSMSCCPCGDCRNSLT